MYLNLKARCVLSPSMIILDLYKWMSTSRFDAFPVVWIRACSMIESCMEEEKEEEEDDEEENWRGTGTA